ncbi:MAG: hypothetical protein HKN08_10800, partial [Gammaproteobacteria bacterium]|nr:hypothetical protein [Gammaproteobacteria bacterium]
ELSFKELMEFEEIEDAVNHLRLKKNAIMFKILVCFITGRCSLEEIELNLTKLSEKILQALIQLVAKQSGNDEVPITVLGMGRMAGHEMTFGSDLDLIFLFDENNQEINASLNSIVRLLLRLVAQPSAYGQLYDVDMRLRPHGSSGPLITTYSTFLEFHSAEREVWEKQMMTRARPVFSCGGDINSIMEKLYSYIYRQYDESILREDIVSMRKKVESILGKLKGNYEIKRGAGGLMDIDFITHYFQLRYGYLNNALQTTSTRQVIKELQKSGYIDNKQGSELLKGYDFLKKVETTLRLFDLKSIDSFSMSEKDNLPLSRAMGHGDDTTAFLDNYLQATATIRSHFDKLVGAFD